MALQLRPNCEGCDQDLPPAAPDWGRSRRIAALAEVHAGAAEPPEIATVLAGCSPAALPHARAALVRRLADAIRCPAEPFLALGARLLYDRSDDPEEPLYVYADPAGHPFCVFVAE